MRYFDNSNEHAGSPSNLLHYVKRVAKRAPYAVVLLRTSTLMNPCSNEEDTNSGDIADAASVTNLAVSRWANDAQRSNHILHFLILRK